MGAKGAAIEAIPQQTTQLLAQGTQGTGAYGTSQADQNTAASMANLAQQSQAAMGAMAPTATAAQPASAPSGGVLGQMPTGKTGGFSPPAYSTPQIDPTYAGIGADQLQPQLQPPQAAATPAALQQQQALVTQLRNPACT